MAGDWVPVFVGGFGDGVDGCQSTLVCDVDLVEWVAGNVPEEIGLYGAFSGPVGSWEASDAHGA